MLQFGYNSSKLSSLFTLGATELPILRNLTIFLCVLGAACSRTQSSQASQPESKPASLPVVAVTKPNLETMIVEIVVTGEFRA